MLFFYFIFLQLFSIKKKFIAVNPIISSKFAKKYKEPNLIMVDNNNKPIEDVTKYDKCANKDNVTAEVTPSDADHNIIDYKTLNAGAQIDLFPQNYWSFGVLCAYNNSSIENFKISAKQAIALNKKDFFEFGPYLTFWMYNIFYINILAGASNCNLQYKISNKKHSHEIKYMELDANYFSLIFQLSFGIRLDYQYTIFFSVGLAQALEETYLKSFTDKSNGIGKCPKMPGRYITFNVGVLYTGMNDNNNYKILSAIRNI